MDAFVEVGALIIYPPVAVSECVSQITLTHSTKAVEIVPASGLNVQDIADLILPEERFQKCTLHIAESGGSLNLTADADAGHDWRGAGALTPEPDGLRHRSRASSGGDGGIALDTLLSPAAGSEVASRADTFMSARSVSPRASDLPGSKPSPSDQAFGLSPPRLNLQSNLSSGQPDSAQQSHPIAMSSAPSAAPHSPMLRRPSRLGFGEVTRHGAGSGAPPLSPNVRPQLDRARTMAPSGVYASSSAATGAGMPRDGQTSPMIAPSSSLRHQMHRQQTMSSLHLMGLADDAAALSAQPQSQYARKQAEKRRRKRREQLAFAPSALLALQRMDKHSSDHDSDSASRSEHSDSDDEDESDHSRHVTHHASTQHAAAASAGMCVSCIRYAYLWLTLVYCGVYARAAHRRAFTMDLGAPSRTWLMQA